MTKNVGSIDRIVRIVIGLGLLWYAIFAAPHRLQLDWLDRGGSPSSRP